MSTDGWRQLLFRRDLIGGFAGILCAKYLAKTDTYGANSEPTRPTIYPVRRLPISSNTNSRIALRTIDFVMMGGVVARDDGREAAAY
jgi:hypothetical protein